MKRHVFTQEDRDKLGPKVDPITKAKNKPTSRKLAINAKCYECQGSDADRCWQWRAPLPVEIEQHRYSILSGFFTFASERAGC